MEEIVKSWEDYIHEDLGITIGEEAEDIEEEAISEERIMAGTEVAVEAEEEETITTTNQTTWMLNILVMTSHGFERIEEATDFICKKLDFIFIVVVIFEDKYID